MADFDCPDHYLEQCYLVQIPRSVRETVDVFEVYGRPPQPTEPSWSPEVTLRAQLPKAKWDAVSGELRLEFNRRLKAHRRHSSRGGLLSALRVARLPQCGSAAAYGRL